MQIFVRSCHGTCLLNTNLQSGTVETLKCLVEEREGIPAKDQYLIFGAKPLRDGTLLRDYAIRDESTIDVLPRIRGGR
jgi:ubiquitin-large subunit ribosomal protein L40e